MVVAAEANPFFDGPEMGEIVEGVKGSARVAWSGIRRAVEIIMFGQESEKKDDADSNGGDGNGETTEAPLHDPRTCRAQKCSACGR